MKFLYKLCFTFLLIIINVTALADSNIIRFGLMNFYPPFVSTNVLKQSYGFDVAVAQAICKQINKTCVFYNMAFADLFPSLDLYKVDAIMSAILITAERNEHYAMTAPYYKAEMSFLTTAGKNINVTPEGLKNLRIGTIKGTIFVDYVKANYPNIPLLLYSTAASTLYHLSKGDVDLVLFDTLNAKWWVLNGNNQFKLAGKNILAGGYGIAVRKDNTVLLNELNYGLQKIKDNGRLQQIIENYILFD